MSTTRDPDETRRTLLEAASKEMYEVGFRAASIDRILGSTGVTKGALYHHFKGKSELGYAVVDELLAHDVLERWVKPLAKADLRLIRCPRDSAVMRVLGHGLSEQHVDEKTHPERVITSVDVECPACRRRAMQVALNGRLPEKTLTPATTTSAATDPTVAPTPRPVLTYQLQATRS